MHEAAITEPSPMPVPVCDDRKSSNFGGIVRNFKKPGDVVFVVANCLLLMPFLLPFNRFIVSNLLREPYDLVMKGGKLPGLL
jgi:hypothetical protein